jgi:hypothetical protein
MGAYSTCGRSGGGLAKSCRYDFEPEEPERLAEEPIFSHYQSGVSGFIIPSQTKCGTDPAF